MHGSREKSHGTNASLKAMILSLLVQNALEIAANSIVETRRRSVSFGKAPGRRRPGEGTSNDEVETAI
jgi:hypothetical protein